MAKPIRPTPELECKDAIEFLEWMEEPPTEKDKEFWKEVYSQRRVLFQSIKWRSIKMAKPISPSPVIEGEDAIKIVKKMYKSPSGEYKELAKEIRSQRFVPF